MSNVGSFSYDNNATPPGYRCAGCGLEGVKLWRESHSSHVDLRCAACAGATADLTDCDQIGDRVPAVPDEDGETWWGYTSVPQAGCEWWARLPYVVAVRPGRKSMTAAEARAVDAKFAAAKDKRRADEEATIDDMIASTVVAVEATGYESMTLWREWNEPRDRRPKVQWDHISLGAWFQIGKFHDAPVCVSFSFARDRGVLGMHVYRRALGDDRGVDREEDAQGQDDERDELPPAGDLTMTTTDTRAAIDAVLAAIDADTHDGRAVSLSDHAELKAALTDHVAAEVARALAAAPVVEEAIAGCCVAFVDGMALEVDCEEVVALRAAIASDRARAVIESRPTPDEARRLVGEYAAAHGELVLLMHGGQYDPFDDEGTRRAAAESTRAALLRALGVES